MIRPGVPAPNLADRIGREVVRERGGAEYRELKTRSLVNRCDSPRVPFEWTVNPYRGCAMGCRYCYAAYTHEYLGLPAAESFHSSIYFKTGGDDETMRRLAATIRRGSAEKGGYVLALGADHVAVIGNGADDVAMLNAAAVRIAVMGPEGTAAALLGASDVLARDITEALDMLLYPQRLSATLRR